MIPEDRELLLSLRRQQADLQQMLERLNARLEALEARADASAPGPAPLFPPLPSAVAFPPIPTAPHAAAEPAALAFPPIPTASPSHAAAADHGLPPVPTTPATSKPSFEFQVGRWLARIGAVVLVLAFAFFAAWADVTYHLHERLGAIGKFGIMGLAGMVVIAVGQRFERNKTIPRFFAWTVLAAGLGCLYVTLYSAYYSEHLRITASPLIAGLLLLAWSIYVLLLAERKNSQLLAVCSVTLAYISSAINPVVGFTMVADLILAATAAAFLLRSGWAALSMFSLVGTYLALLRRLVIDDSGELVLDTSRTLHYWPYAIYLIFAWLIFTGAAIFTSAPTFQRGRRLAFLSLNNAGLAGLLALTAYIAGYGDSAIGWTLLNTGIVFLVASRVAGFAENDPVDIMGAYAAQGLALVTGGIMVVYTGITRGVLLLIEAFLLGVAGAFSGDRILTVSTYVASFFATLFLIWEIAVNAHHPWLLGFGGAAVMLINAWNSRSEVRDSPVARSTVVLSTSCYCILAVGLIATALATKLGDATLPPALALAALVLTFSIYQFSIYELPPIAQTLLISAQVLVLFPAETGEELPWWTTAWVAVVTLLLVTWWARQRITRTGGWTILLTFLYALALAGLAHQTIRPYLDAQGWMIGASLLSFVFLCYGAFTRVWAVAAVGQIFLALSLYHFFFPPDRNVFPWSWSAAVVPMLVAFSTGRAANNWVNLFTEIPEPWRRAMHFVACGYMLLALAALIRLVFGVVPALDQVAAFFFLGTLVLSRSVRHASAFGVRCSFALSILGMLLYFGHLAEQAHAMATFLNGLAVLLFLAQAALLRHEGKSLVTAPESWALIVFSALASWIFVSAWVWTRFSPGDLTLGWALDALLLFLFGLLVREPRLRWCGLVVIAATILRVICYDVWGLPTAYRAITLGFLALVLLGIGLVLVQRGANSDHSSSGD